MSANFKKIKELILSSTLNNEDKEELLLGLFTFPDEDLKLVLKLFSDNPSWIQKIMDNYKAKRAAMLTGSSKLWNQILEEEVRLLKKFN